MSFIGTSDFLYNPLPTGTYIVVKTFIRYVFHTENVLLRVSDEREPKGGDQKPITLKFHFLLEVILFYKSLPYNE